LGHSENSIQIEIKLFTFTRNPALFTPHTFKFIGIVIVNVDPLPTSLATLISPPMRLMNFLTIANPNPVPPYFLVLYMSA
jgi:hypothetical protein